MPYYGVAKGRNPGIYQSWDECKAQVDSYSNNCYKKFDSPNDAHHFIQDNSSGGGGGGQVSSSGSGSSVVRSNGGGQGSSSGGGFKATYEKITIESRAPSYYKK